MSRIKEIWDNFKENNSRSVGMTSQVLEYEGKVNCILGYIPITGIKVFQFEIEKDLKIERNWLRKFRGAEIQVLPSNSVNLFSILLIDSSLDDIFNLFIEDVIMGLIEASTSIEAVKLITTKVGYWEKLFAKASGELLSGEYQRGLYGELVFLKELLNHSSDFEKAVVSWRGPESSNQDFSNELSAVEVKSSKATKPSVNISNEFQLDCNGLDNLFLCVIHVDEISNGVDTLQKLIEEIKLKISNQPNLLNLFEEKLDQVGIPLGEEKHYDDFGFIIRSIRAYKVDDGFPALTRDNLDNDAIHNVKYQIDLVACKSFEVETKDVINEMI